MLCKDVWWGGQAGPSPQGDPPPASPAAVWGAVQGVWAELEVENGIPTVEEPSTPPYTPPLPLSCLHPWAEEEEGGRGERAKREQVGTRDGVFAQEPCVSHFLSLPELIG